MNEKQNIQIEYGNEDLREILIELFKGTIHKIYN